MQYMYAIYAYNEVLKLSQHACLVKRIPGCWVGDWHEQTPCCQSDVLLHTVIPWDSTVHPPRQYGNLPLTQPWPEAHPTQQMSFFFLHSLWSNGTWKGVLLLFFFICRRKVLEPFHMCGKDKDETKDMEEIHTSLWHIAGLNWKLSRTSNYMSSNILIWIAISTRCILFKDFVNVFAVISHQYIVTLLYIYISLHINVYNIHNFIYNNKICTWT